MPKYQITLTYPAVVEASTQQEAEDYVFGRTFITTTEIKPQ